MEAQAIIASFKIELAISWERKKLQLCNNFENRLKLNPITLFDSKHNYKSQKFKLNHKIISYFSDESIYPERLNATFGTKCKKKNSGFLPFSNCDPPPPNAG